MVNYFQRFTGFCFSENKALSELRSREAFRCTEKSFIEAREIVADALLLPPELANKLRPDDDVVQLYDKTTKRSSDSCELEVLRLEIERLLNRLLTERELENSRTIRDIALLIQNARESPELATGQE